MTKQVTATFTVETREMWVVGNTVGLGALKSLDKEQTLVEVRNESGNVVGWVLEAKDASSLVTDHNRTTRVRAKQREARKNAS